MSKFSGALSRRYGTALFDILLSISKSSSEFEIIVQKIQKISKFLNKKVIKYLEYPSLNHEERNEFLLYFLKEIFKEDVLEEEIISFFKLILANKRFKDIKSILIFFMNKSDEYLKIARAIIYAPRPIDEQNINDFEQALTKVLQKRIVFKVELDESLKSGFVLKLGNINIDSSFKARLNSLKELFI